MEHISVLKKEAIEALNIKSDGIYLDLTLGMAGHSAEILSRLSIKGKLISFDLDSTAILESKKILNKFKNKNYELINSNYKYFDKYLLERNISKVDGILLDLGVSSPQFDDASRGFSYNKDSLLDMRMDNVNNKLTAKYIVNNYPLEKLIKIFKEYGEEKDAFKIASNIVKFRENKQINSTNELVEIIKQSKSFKELNKKGHPAKQVFQALRIEVNDELNSLKETLEKAFKYLSKDGRIVVITFHSLEDRIVKNAFNSVSKIIGNRNDDYSFPTSKVEFELVNKKVIIPSNLELENNKRSKSAKLRAIRKI